MKFKRILLLSLAVCSLFLCCSDENGVDGDRQTDIITVITANPPTVPPAGSTGLYCNINLPDTCEVEYEWSYSDGLIFPAGNHCPTAVWEAPGDTGRFTVTAIVHYGNTFDEDEVEITVAETEGHPPPPVPLLECSLSVNMTTLDWQRNPSEDPDYRDPVSGLQDFEGYRVYIASARRFYGGNNEAYFAFSLIYDFDKIDFAYFSITDSMVTVPDARFNAPLDTVIGGETYFRRQVGANTGFEAILTPDSTYAITFSGVNWLEFPRWYAVTAYDFGNPFTGEPSRETGRTDNAVYVGP